MSCKRVLFGPHGISFFYLIFVEIPCFCEALFVFDFNHEIKNYKLTSRLADNKN
jgi:hypothetical protein